MTRRSSAGRSRLAARWSRSQCGAWVEGRMVRRSPSGSTTMASGSMGHGAMRWLTVCVRTSVRPLGAPGSPPASSPASSSPASSSPASNCAVRATLLPTAGKSSSAPGAAAVGSSTTTGSGVVSTTMSSAASAATAALSATTMARISPANRMRSVASGGRRNPSSTKGWANVGSWGASPRSSAPGRRGLHRAAAPRRRRSGRRRRGPQWPSPGSWSAPRGHRGRQRSAGLPAGWSRPRGAGPVSPPGLAASRVSLLWSHRDRRHVAPRLDAARPCRRAHEGSSGDRATQWVSVRSREDDADATETGR